jgi:hypothetical protein
MALVLLLLTGITPQSHITLNDGDRIVFVGGALIEREQQHGHVEVMLHAMYPETKFSIRNLGWSGDTVWGEARAGFGKQPDGYKKLVEQIKAAKPNVLFLNYGSTEAFAGQGNIQKWVAAYKQLISDVKGEKTQLVYLMPSHMLSRTAKNAAMLEKERTYNEALSHYIGQFQLLKVTHPGITIFLEQLYVGKNARDLTDDGLLPNEAGYRELAKVFAFQLGRRDLENKDLSSWEPLRQLILKKNELYFHQYRPQNDTYLFGFRKHEQGQNAKEMPQFTKLIEELDEQINEMKKKLHAGK